MLSDLDRLILTACDAAIHTRKIFLDDIEEAYSTYKNDLFERSTVVKALCSNYLETCQKMDEAMRDTRSRHRLSIEQTAVFNMLGRWWDAFKQEVLHTHFIAQRFTDHCLKRQSYSILQQFSDKREGAKLEKEEKDLFAKMLDLTVRTFNL